MNKSILLILLFYSPVFAFQESEVTLSFVLSETRTYLACEAPLSETADGRIDLFASTKIQNNGLIYNYYNSAELKTTLNGATYLTGRRNSSNKYTKVSESVYLPASIGSQGAITEHTGFIEWIIEPVVPIASDTIRKTTSAFCVIPTYQPPQNDDCTRGCSPGNESFQFPCKARDRVTGKSGWQKTWFDWEGCQESPLLIDLGKNGFRLGRRGEGAYFDILGIGEQFFMQWVRPGGDEVFLVRDLNQNGVVDDGRELFGEGTRLVLQDNQPSPNGFIALAQFDHPELGGNNDGYISQLDEIWFELQLWHDRNADGVTDVGELLNLEDQGLTRLEIIPRESRRRDSAGNSLRYWSWVFDDQAKVKYRMVDVFFRRIQ